MANLHTYTQYSTKPNRYPISIPNTHTYLGNLQTLDSSQYGVNCDLGTMIPEVTCSDMEILNL